MFKRREVIVLPSTDLNAPYYKHIETEEFTYKPVYQEWFKHPHHLYILSDEPINEGDWVTNGTSVWKFVKELITIKHNKIIATTDGSLSLPQPSIESLKYLFLDHFTILKKVMVEYEKGYCLCGDTPASCTSIEESMCSWIDTKLKLDSKDNTIIVKKTQTNWNESELLEIIAKVANDVRQHGFGGHSVAHAYAGYWFRKNL